MTAIIHTGKISYASNAAGGKILDALKSGKSLRWRTRQGSLK